MAVKILIDGPGAEELETAVRGALGDPPEEETWLVSLVKQQPAWTVSILVAPDERLWGWTYVGMRRDVPSAIARAVATAGLDGEVRRGAGV